MVSDSYTGSVRGVRLSDSWDLDGDVLVHYDRHSAYPEHYDSRACCAHETEVVHYGRHDVAAVAELIAAGAGPQKVAEAIAAAIEAERLARTVHPDPPPVAAILSHGREVREVRGGYEVQPPNDNYWVWREHLADAIDVGEGRQRPY